MSFSLLNLFYVKSLTLLELLSLFYRYKYIQGYHSMCSLNFSSALQNISSHNLHLKFSENCSFTRKFIPIFPLQTQFDIIDVKRFGKSYHNIQYKSHILIFILFSNET